MAVRTWSRAASRRVVREAGRVRAFISRVPLVGRVVQDIVRIQPVDRAVVIAAQALFALVPLVVVLAAFRPSDVTSVTLERFGQLTGMSQVSTETVSEQMRPLSDRAEVRSETGIVGILVVVLSAGSFARAVMRACERIWEVQGLTGLSARRRGLLWLVGWLAGVQVLSAVGWVADRIAAGVSDAPAEVFLVVGHLAVIIAPWWWSLRFLLSGQASWRSLFVPAVATGVALSAYTTGSRAVMPAYTARSAEQFGAFGVVLGIASWLIGAAAVLVGAAILGRGLVEDPWLRDQAHRLRLGVLAHAPRR